jgi:Peptidase S24-like
MFVGVMVERGLAYWWRPRGLSMVPTIRDGDRVLIAPVPATSLRLGDVVKFWLEGELRLHRLIRRGSSPDGPWLEFHGDRLTEPDSRVRPAAVIGIARAVEREGHLRRLDSLPARLAALARVGVTRVRTDRGGRWSRTGGGRGRGP